MASLSSVSPRGPLGELCLRCLNMREKFFGGDSGGFGVIRGNRLGNGVLDGTNRAPWGEKG